MLNNLSFIHPNQKPVTGTTALTDKNKTFWIFLELCRNISMVLLHFLLTASVL